MIDTIIQIGLEIYKNKDTINRVFHPKYLNYDLIKLLSYYIDENLIDKRIPYVELCDFIKNNEKHIKFSILDKDFKLENNNSTAIKTFQINALKEFKQKGKFTFDSNTIRLNGFKSSENELTLEIQKSKYSDQVQSHLVLDWENKALKDIGSNNLRGVLISKFGHKLPPLNSSLLSNSIGISCIIYFQKGTNLLPYLPFRNKSIFRKKRDEPAIYEGIYHCSSSGVLEWKDDINGMNDITDEMYREIEEEIGLNKMDIISLEPIALTRELLRAGKPQIFFIGFTNLSETQLIEKRKEAVDISKSNTEKVEIKNKHLNLEDENVNIKNTVISLETIGNLYYCERYFEKNGREQKI